MRYNNVLYTLILLCIYANCKPNAANPDISSVDSTNTTLSDLSVHDSARSDTLLTDNFYYGNIEDKGESEKTSFQDDVYLKYRVESDDGNVECILERSEFYLSWWVHENGSLRLPSINRTNVSGFLDLSIQYATESSIFNQVLSFTSQHPKEVIRMMSLANNMLRNIPTSVLLLTSSLQYLSLADNNFYRIFDDENTTFENFTTFPILSKLLELDLRNCHMTSLKSSYFINLPSLLKLYASHNYFTSINSNDVTSLKNLVHLDISYNEFSSKDGLYLDKRLFNYFPKLRFLDFSHTRLAQNSSESLKYLGSSIVQMSLCYTNIKALHKETFSETNLKVLDLSGNDELYENLTPHHFQYLDDSLEIFVFRNANIHDKELFTYLRKLRMLDLRHNKIDSLMPFDFGLLENLEILDLENNKISNWKYRLFAENKNIKIINLRNNHITVMKTEMLQDFYGTSYLAIGSNDFICACNLRDFIDRAIRNTLYRHCKNKTRSKRSLETEPIILTPSDQYDVISREVKLISKYYQKSYRNMLAPILEKLMDKFSKKPVLPMNNQGKTKDDETDPPLSDCNDFDADQITYMNFDFLLLDYDEKDYKCSKPKELGYSSRIYFNQLESCFSGIDTTSPHEGSSEDFGNSTELPDYGPIEEEIYTKSKYVILNMVIVIFLAICGCLWYWKRKDINYFLSLFKNSFILSFDADDKKALMLSNRKKSTNSFDHFSYDVFVSYSDNDRSWVLDELIPNIEKSTDINICLHERDFQVGLSILENIIQCMDKSRCLLLVVSESFLKSNWCSFEMHLAQHRLIETRREQLILVLLQDIARPRRTRTLQYLMRTKTYIMWPNDGKKESKVNFWKRLKKAIVLNDKDSEKNMALRKQRHSIV